jgi:hypothetical protein
VAAHHLRTGVRGVADHGVEPAPLLENIPEPATLIVPVKWVDPSAEI